MTEMAGVSASRKTKRFATSYSWDDATWCSEIYAYDWADAEARCKALNMKLLGEFDDEVPVPGSPCGWRTRLCRRLGSQFVGRGILLCRPSGIRWIIGHTMIKIGFFLMGI